MGFAVWRQSPLIYCAGTHEYRPMGMAVVHESGTLQARDFSQSRAGLVRGGEGFIGYFASLSAVNDWLRRGARAGRRNSHRVLGTL